VATTIIFDRYVTATRYPDGTVYEDGTAWAYTPTECAQLAAVRGVGERLGSVPLADQYAANETLWADHTAVLQGVEDERPFELLVMRRTDTETKEPGYTATATRYVVDF
jgi:hypothetical protein